MSTDTSTLNPYRPCVIPHDARQWIACNPSAPVCVSRVRRAWLYRELTLSGLLETTIVWDARGSYELVRVAGRKVAGRLAWWFVPKFEFCIQAPELEYDLAAAIEVHVSCFLRTQRFCLKLNDQIIYQEPSKLPMLAKPVTLTASSTS